jgi:hypothetical protein
MDNNVTPITRTAEAVQPPQPPPRFPKSVEAKVTVAKSIVLAVRAAHDNGELEDENYDMSWPLSMVVELLEQAANQIDRERLEATHA